jgi:RNA polymerase sigma factor (sigma-70 family)
MQQRNMTALRDQVTPRTYTASVHGPPTEVLVARVLGAGEDAPDAWDELVRRFSDLVWKVLRGFDLSDADRWDGFQATWLRSLEKLHTLRDPSRFAGWLAQVATNEVRSTILRYRTRVKPLDIRDDGRRSDAIDLCDTLLKAEMVDAVRAGFAELGPECQHLLRLLVADPPLSYREIEAVLNRPVGSIGPTRRRCLEKLRRTAALLALYGDSEPQGTTTDE